MKVVSEATLIVNKLRRKRTKQPQTVDSTDNWARGWNQGAVAE